MTHNLVTVRPHTVINHWSRWLVNLALAWSSTYANSLSHRPTVKGPITIAIRLRFDLIRLRFTTKVIKITIRLRFDYRLDCVNESGCRHSRPMLLKARAVTCSPDDIFLSRCRLQNINNFWTNQDIYGYCVCLVASCRSSNDNDSSMYGWQQETRIAVIPSTSGTTGCHSYYSYLLGNKQNFLCTKIGRQLWKNHSVLPRRCLLIGYDASRLG